MFKITIKIIGLFLCCVSPVMCNEGEKGFELWLVKRGAIQIYPNATLGKSVLKPQKIEVVSLYKLERLIYKGAGDAMLSNIFSSARTDSSAEHFDPFLGQILRCAIYEKSSKKWYMVMLDNVSGDRFLISKCDSAFAKILTEISEYRESKDKSVLNILKKRKELLNHGKP